MIGDIRPGPTFLPSPQHLTICLHCLPHHNQFGTMWSASTFTINLFHALIKSLRTILPGGLRLAPHAPSLCWHALLLLSLISQPETACRGLKGPEEPKPPKKKKKKGSLGETFAVLKSSPKILSLAMLVMSYGVSHRLFEFAWKGQLRVLFPSAQAYQVSLTFLPV